MFVFDVGTDNKLSNHKRFSDFMRGQDLERALLAGCSAATSIISRFPRREIKRGELAGALSFAEAPLYAQS